MKILMTADTIGGVWSYTIELCSALKPYGAQIALATLGRTLSRSQRSEVASLSHVDVHESTYRLEWMPSPWESLANAGEWLLSLEQRHVPDVVHLNHLVHAEMPWSAPTLVVGHSCVYSWWSAVHGGSPGAEWARYHRRVKTSLHAATRVVTPSRAMLAALCRHYGPLPHARVIPNARDPKHYGSGRKHRMILCAGRLWDEAKNVRALCEIAPSLPWPVFVAGPCEGPEGQRLELNDVACLGPLDSSAMKRWLSAAAIYAAPARYEPFGLTPLEAALSGCALVLGDIDSLREVWGRAALYVKPDSPDALRAAIVSLIEQPGLLPLYAKRARAQAARFDPRQLAASYWNLYESMQATTEIARCGSYCSITH